MKIAHIITRLVAGGAQHNTLSCAAQQHRAGHQVTVISGLETGSEGSLLETARQAEYRWVGVPSLVREISPRKDLRALVKLVRLFRSERFQLVHTHTSKAGLIGRLAAQISGSPIVVHTPHGHVFHSYFNPIKTRLFVLMERAFAAFGDAFVMLTHQELADHFKAGIHLGSRSVVIPSGVSLEKFHTVEPRPSVFTVGYVGRLADIKGPLDLLEAFHLHRTQFSQSRLLIVGDGPQRGEVEARIRELQLGDAVEMVGWQDDIPSYLSQMSILAVPSHNEGMGRVVVEAMASGLPVLATSVGGLLDLVEPERNGLLVPAKQPAVLAEALSRMAKEPDLLVRMGRQGRLRAEHFSDQVMFSRLEALYSRLAFLKGVR